MANLFQQEQGHAWERVLRAMDQGGWIIRLKEETLLIWETLS